MSKGLPYTPKEDQVLKDYYPRGGIRACLSRLPGRNRNSISNRTRRLDLFAGPAPTDLVCPYCNERPLRDKTCGARVCQNKRNNAKTLERRRLLKLGIAPPPQTRKPQSNKLPNNPPHPCMVKPNLGRKPSLQAIEESALRRRFDCPHEPECSDYAAFKGWRRFECVQNVPGFKCEVNQRG